jgi:aspartyl-tRNA(Asn)/glutamyl-tRNA(Gln) amidotransferase subunit C
MSLTSSDIESIAHLARLALRPEEIPAYTDSLGHILGLADQLQRVDTEGIEPMAHPHVGQVQRLREDEVTSANERDRIQRLNAPAVEDGLYLVPRVLE